jgi:hypothetical protein
VPPDPILTIHREGDHLSVQENVEPRQELFAASEEIFSRRRMMSSCSRWAQAAG